MKRGRVAQMLLSTSLLRDTSPRLLAGGDSVSLGPRHPRLCVSWKGRVRSGAGAGTRR
jgi:hypothetical protein